MNKELCFKINSKELYLEKVLVTHNDIPMYFICTDDMLNYYVVLFTDIDEDRYIITKTNINKIIELFKRKITMKDLIISTYTEKYWEIIASDDINKDIIREKDIKEISVEDLPDEDSYFNLSEKSNKEFFNELLNKVSKQALTNYLLNKVSKQALTNYAAKKNYNNIMDKINRYMIDSNDENKYILIHNDLAA